MKYSVRHIVRLNGYSNRIHVILQLVAYTADKCTHKDRPGKMDVNTTVSVWTQAPGSTDVLKCKLIIVPLLG